MDLVKDVLVPFTTQTGDNSRFQVISQAPNSFEGWLKWELVGWSTQEFFGNSKFDPNKVGVEARVRLHKCPEQDKAEKLVDYWIDAGKHRYHFVELKIVFGNQNMKKQATLAGWDFWYLATLKPEESAASIATMIYVQAGADPGQVAKIAVESMAPLSPASMTIGAPAGGSWVICHMPWEEAHGIVATVC